MRPPSAPRTQADLIRDQARDAMQRGESALAAGNPAQSRAWFERARRTLPSDPAIAFALGSVLLRQADPAARALFIEAATSADTREIWLGLAAAALRAADAAAGRAALARMLSGHVLPAAVAPLLPILEHALRSDPTPGWCGVARTADGLALHWIASLEGALARADGLTLPTPHIPPGARSLEVTCNGTPLLGSPINLAQLRRLEGFVTEADGGLAGWAWHPSDADTDPFLTLTDESGTTRLCLRAADTDFAAPRPMTRPRRFTIPAADLRRFSGRLTLRGQDGRPLPGSPVDPAAPVRAAMEMARLAALECPATGTIVPHPTPTDLSAPAHLSGPPAKAPLEPGRPVAVVIPAYRGVALTRACLSSVFATCPKQTPVIVVDDATPEPALARLLDTLAEQGRITLLRLAENRGFPAAANAGLRAAFALVPPHDVVLLNSDTLLPTTRGPSWLERLRAAVHATPDIGTAAPLSNDATILSYPNRDAPNALPDARALARLNRHAAVANPGLTVDIPTSVGFCMYVRHECALATGLFRPSLFAQGYGEENDFCIRARHLGWRHVAVPGTIVAHLGGASFGDARAPLIARNLAVLERLHPGYHALIAVHQADIPAQDALAPARRRIDTKRWAEGRKPASILLATHDSGGGVERVVQSRIAEITAGGGRAVILRPVPDPNSDGGFMPGICRISDGGADQHHPNLIFRLPQDLPILIRLLRPDRPAMVEIHHRLGLPPEITEIATRLGIPTEFRLHDYASLCPRITLLGPDRRYCGEPVDVETCEACVADAGSRTGEQISVRALRERSAQELAKARRIVVPSADMANRLRRHFPQAHPDVAPLEHDAAVSPPPPPPATRSRRIAVIGAIGIEKGFDVLLACARDAAARALPLEFVLVGHSTDDHRLIDTGRVFVTGRYTEPEAESLLRAQSAHLAFLPSIWPETWGFTLGLAWRAGLHAAVFDIGAMAARIRATGHGIVLPLGLPAGAINNALLRAGLPTA